MNCGEILAPCCDQCSECCTKTNW